MSYFNTLLTFNPSLFPQMHVHNATSVLSYAYSRQHTHTTKYTDYYNIYTYCMCYKIVHVLRMCTANSIRLLLHTNIV